MIISIQIYHSFYPFYWVLKEQNSVKSSTQQKIINTGKTYIKIKNCPFQSFAVLEITLNIL